MRNPSPALMIFAAGFGTRMRPLTLTRPKPLIEVDGVSLIDRTIDLALEVSPARIVVNLHYRSDMLATHLTERPVETLIEAPNILDTGGGLRHALPLLGSDPVMTSNSDAIWLGPNPFDWLLRAWDPVHMDALLLCVPLAQTVGRIGSGDFSIEPNGQLARGRDHVYGGIQILKTSLLDSISEPAFSLNVVWDQMAKSGRLYGTTYDGQWCDIGRPEGIALAEEMLRQGIDA